MCAQKVGARIVIGRYGYKSSFGANKSSFGANKTWPKILLKQNLVKNTAEAIPWQGILEEDAGEENCVKDREAPGDEVDLDDDQNGEEVDPNDIDLGDCQFSERCNVDGSFFNSDAIPILFGKA